MNSPFIFHPYWPYFPSQSMFSVFQPTSVTNYLVSNQSYLNAKEITQKNTIQKKGDQMERQVLNCEKRSLEKKKNLKKVKQDKNFSYRYQDKDRNIYSNILKGVITKLREDRNYQLYCEQLMKNKKVGFSFSELLDFLEQNFEKNKTYISPGFMKKVLQIAEPIEIRDFFMLILSKYLKEGFTLVLLGSQRIQKQSKILQMRKSRELWKQLFSEENTEQKVTMQV